MGEMNLLAIILAAAAFSAVGLVWYGVLFGTSWRRAARLPRRQIASRNLPVMFGLCFAFELLIALVLAHQFAMTGAGPRAVMMIAVGLGAGVMVPAVGIHYLFLRKSSWLFAVDAGHIIAGMAAMGGVFAYFA